MDNSANLILALRDTAKNIRSRGPALAVERLVDAADALAECDRIISELHAVAKDYQRERDAWLAWGKANSNKGNDLAIKRDIADRLAELDARRGSDLDIARDL